MCLAQWQGPKKVLERQSWKYGGSGDCQEFLSGYLCVVSVSVRVHLPLKTLFLHFSALYLQYLCVCE